MHTDTDSNDRYPRSPSLPWFVALVALALAAASALLSAPDGDNAADPRSRSEASQAIDADAVPLLDHSVVERDKRPIEADPSAIAIAAYEP